MKLFAQKLRPGAVVGALLWLCSPGLRASENAPHGHFAEWADVPDRGQLIVGVHYEESEAYYFWAGDHRYKSDFVFRGEHFGIDINQGYVALQYGLTERWTAEIGRA